MIRDDGLLIAGDGRRGDDDPVAGLDLHLAMAGEGHAVQGGHVLALGAGGDDDHLILRQGFDLIDIHHQAFGDFQIAQLRGDLENILHRSGR